MKRHRTKRGIILVALVAGFSIIGTTYGMWTDRLVVRENVTTGNFSMEITDDLPWEGSFGEMENDAALDFSDENIQRVIQGNGKSAKVQLMEGIPGDGTVMGGYLDLKIPMKAKDDGITTVRLTDVKENVQETPIKAKVAAMALVMDGEVYDAENLLEDFDEDMEFILRTGTEQLEEEGQYMAAVSLQLTEKSKDKIEKFPALLEVEADEFGELEIAKDWENVNLDVTPMDSEIIGSSTGIAVLYTLEVPVMFDQAGAESQEGDGQMDGQEILNLTKNFGWGMKAYAYWTDRIDLEIEIPVVYFVEVEVLEEEEDAAAGSE